MNEIGPKIRIYVLHMCVCPHPSTDDDRKKRERLQIANSVLSLAKQVRSTRAYA